MEKMEKVALVEFALSLFAVGITYVLFGLDKLNLITILIAWTYVVIGFVVVCVSLYFMLKFYRMK